MEIISEFLCIVCKVREITAPAEPPDNLAGHNDIESLSRSSIPYKLKPIPLQLIWP